MKENELIAEFMGVDQVDIDQAYNDYGELRYHTSWDWLMPVVEEIDHMEYESERLTKIDNAIKTRSIKNVYKAVVEFIKDYNKYICGSCGENCNEYTYNEETDVDECNQCKTI